MAKEENSLYEIVGGIINGVSLSVISTISITSSNNYIIAKFIVIFLIMIMVVLYYLLRERFNIYNNNNDTANQIYFYLSIVLFISQFVLLLKG